MWGSVLLGVCFHRPQKQDSGTEAGKAGTAVATEKGLFCLGPRDEAKRPFLRCCHRPTTLRHSHHQAHPLCSSRLWFYSLSHRGLPASAHRFLPSFLFLKNFILCFFFFLIFIYLIAAGLHFDAWTLSLWHAGWSSLTWDQTQAPCIGSWRSRPLDLQGSPTQLSLLQSFVSTAGLFPAFSTEKVGCTYTSGDSYPQERNGFLMWLINIKWPSIIIP